MYEEGIWAEPSTLRHSTVECRPIRCRVIYRHALETINQERVHSSGKERLYTNLRHTIE
jgi:hypothetical protein